MLNSEYLQALRSIQSENPMNRRVKSESKKNGWVECFYVSAVLMVILFAVVTWGN